MFVLQITKKLKEKEIKRQEHIYEFILTEKHHCLTLRVMQKVRHMFTVCWYLGESVGSFMYEDCSIETR